MIIPMQNDDPLLRYFDAQMRDLRESGREFARAHPDRARSLNPERVTERDPFVERLVEGFAFLAGRLEQKLDDERAGLAQGLVGLLWPHYLRAIPSLSIVELVADTQALTHTTTVPAGLRMRTTPVVKASPGKVGQDKSGTVQCRYRSTQPVALQPLVLTHAAPAVRADGRSVIHLRFEMAASADRTQMDFSTLRLYLHAEPTTACTLHLALTRHVDCISCGIPDADALDVMALPGVTIRPAGFGSHERMLANGDESFSGYPLLLEYFAFRERFLFVDLCGFDIQMLPATSTRFELEILLGEAWPADQHFTEENVRLHCTPVINLFELDAEPILALHQDTEYRVVPSADMREPVETYSIDALTSLDCQSFERHEYVPFATFSHRAGMLWHEATERYFHARARTGASGVRETWITLGGHAWESLDDLPQECISMRLTCMNGRISRNAMRETEINQLEGDVVGVAGVQNLVAPTMTLYPPMDDRFQWRTLSHLAPGFLPLIDAQALRGTLALYDWGDDELNARRLAGILRVRQQAIEEVVRGAVECGVLIEVTLDAHAFAGDADVMLFGEMLHQFFALYAELNQFTKLAIVSLPSQMRTEWPRSKAREYA